jgi:hypothetical protein
VYFVLQAVLRIRITLMQIQTHLDADPDLDSSFHFDAYLNPVRYQSDMNLLAPATAPF